MKRIIALTVSVIMLLTSSMAFSAGDTTAPTPGGSGVITASNITSSSVTLSWTKATDNVTPQTSLKYKVVRSTSNNITTVATANANGTIVTNWTTNISTATASSLTSGTTYYFNVLVKDTAGRTAAYTSMSATPTSTDTTAPTPGGSGAITTSGISSSSVTVGWTAATDNVTAQSSLQYKVVRSLSNNITTATDAAANGTTVTDWTTNITTATASGLTSGTTYYFNVLVKDTVGNTAAYTSTSATTTSTDTTVPTPGGSGVITTSGITSSSVTLGWTAATDNVTAQSSLQYKVVRSLSNNITTVSTAEANGTTVTNWTTNITASTASGLTASTTYYFNVLVKDAAGNTAIYTSKSAATSAASAITYKIVDTDQNTFYDDIGTILTSVSPGADFYGQDPNYTTNASSYVDNGNGTVTDLNTGLMWQQDAVAKQTYDEAIAGAAASTLGGYTDWRMANIKELYSLINFNGAEGVTGSVASGNVYGSPIGNIPFIDDDYFVYYTGDLTVERYIDAQYMSSTQYVSTTMNNQDTVFGVNFVDGRIKGYGITSPATGLPNEFYALYVRGNTNYGVNQFVDNGDGTVTDTATGLMWMQQDSGSFGIGDDPGAGLNGTVTWETALDWAENLTYAGYSDWKLPDAKELQSIVDYSRSPDTTNSPAINPIFDSTGIIMENGVAGWGYYWSSTTHKTGPTATEGKSAAYVCFGEALGYMNSTYMDVHGAGAQRSDPKTGSYTSYPLNFGPQGDVQRVFNFARLVREIN